VNSRHPQSRLLSGGEITFAAAILFGLVVGVGAFTFHYAEGTSYLSDDPAACANCHIMWEQYDSWTASSHSPAVGCVDCHLPHGPVTKWLSKAENGWNHSVAFTLQNYPDPIRIKPRNLRIVQTNCVSCHGDLVHTTLPTDRSGLDFGCTHCHVEVGHAAWR
jgi:cytochrome c nitrite reductase small subunit